MTSKMIGIAKGLEILHDPATLDVIVEATEQYEYQLCEGLNLRYISRTAIASTILLVLIKHWEIDLPWLIKILTDLNVYENPELIEDK